MNKIFLIRKDKVQKGILQFQNNNDIFECEEGKFKFEIKSKEELIIYWGESDIENFKTRDSYLYFSESQTKYNYDNFVKYWIYQEEWKDQIICNSTNHTLHRLNKPEEIGTYTIYGGSSKKYIEIEWEKWGKEVFLSISDKEWIKENYFNNLENKKINSQLDCQVNCPINIPVYLFIHVCTNNNGIDIFEDIIKDVRSSGLYDRVDKILIGIVGTINALIPFIDPKFKILYMDPQVLYYEIKTINYILSYVKKLYNSDEAYIGYVHTKGVRKVGGNMDCVLSWRKMMSYFIIEKFQTCLDYLNEYDTIGVNLCNQFLQSKDLVSVSNEHCIHYSGNFWWSKKSYIENLPILPEDLTEQSVFTRCRAENWICSKYPNAKMGFLFQDDTNTHPYHRFIFDEYKLIYPIVKDISGVCLL